MTGDDEVGDMEDSLPSGVKPSGIRAVRVFGWARLVEPEMGADHQTIGRLDQSGNVLRGMTRGLPQSYVGGDLIALGPMAIPVVVVVRRPVIVNPGVRKHSNVHSVIRMVVTDDHVGDIGYHETQSTEGVRYGKLRRSQARINHNSLISVNDQAHGRANLGPAGAGLKYVKLGHRRTVTPLSSRVGEGGHRRKNPGWRDLL